MLKNLYSKNKKVVFGLLTLFFFILIFCLNRIYPLYIDDWAYALVWLDLPGTSSIRPEPLSGFSDILTSQYNHYMKWGGRSVVHAIAQFLLMLPPLLKYILNTSAYLLCIYIMYLIAKNKNLVQNNLYIIIFLASFILLPSFTETTIWTTGSANYLWGTLLLLLFIYPYYRSLDNNSILKDGEIWRNVLFFLFGIIAGWTNENTAISVVGIIFVYLVYLKITKKSIPRWMLFGFIGLLIGNIVMLVAPGNFIRLNHYTDPNTTTPFLSTIRTGLTNIYHIYKQSPITILSLLSIGMFIFGVRTNVLDLKNRISVLALFVMSHLSIFVMIATPFFPLRATFFATALMIICTFKLWNILFFKYKSICYAILILLFSVFFVKSYHFRYTFIEEFKGIMDRRISLIEKEKSKGNLNIVVTETIDFPKEFDSWDVSTDSTHWINNLYRDYFQIESIRSDK